MDKLGATRLCPASGFFGEIRSKGNPLRDNLPRGAMAIATSAARDLRKACYHCRMFNFGKPKTAGDWIVHIAGAIVAIFLVWWMLRMYVL